MAFKEKRREERFSVDTICTILDDIKVRVLDISKRGIGLLGDIELIEGKAVDMLVSLNGQDIPLRGVVMNVTDYEGKHRYGLELIGYPDSWLDVIYGCMFNNK